MIFMTDRPQQNDIGPIANIESADKARYFTFLGLKYLDQMRLLMRGGGLTKTDKWDNVARHCMTQLAAAEELCGMLGVSKEDTDAACRTAAMHDWEKRFEKTRERLETDTAAIATLESDWENARKEYLGDAQPHQALLDATNPAFLARVIEGKEQMTFAQRLQLYFDMVTDDNEIVPTKERYEKVRSSPRSKGLEALAGGQYWEGIGKMREDIEQELWEHLRERNVEIAKPEDIPLLIRQKVTAHWENQPADQKE